jgi:hypothetical protein
MTKISNQYSLTNVLTADVVNGRVGINNGSPTVALDVTGAGKFSSSLTTAGAIFTTNDSVFSTAGTITKHATVGLTIRGTTASVFDYSLYSAGGTALMTNPTGTNNINFNSGQVWFNGGAVGIGTSSPTFADGSGLHINNNSGSARLRLTNNTTGGTANDGSEFTVAGSDLYVINNENANMLFITNAAERMRITSGGNVGIGTTTPLNKFTVVGVSSFQLSDANDIRLIINPTASGINISGTYNVNGSYQPITISTSDTERMRITSGGKVNITNNLADYSFTVVNSSASGFGMYVQAGGTNNLIDGYNYTGGTALFRVTGGGVIFAQNTSVQSISDIRTKENIIDSKDGLNIISELRPVRFDFKEGWGNNKKNILGFIAQEVEKVFPDVVDEWKNKPEDEITYKTLGPSGLIPVLVKAIQELKAEIEILKQK